MFSLCSLLNLPLPKLGLSRSSISSNCPMILSKPGRSSGSLSQQFLINSPNSAGHFFVLWLRLRETVKQPQRNKRVKLPPAVEVWVIVSLYPQQWLQVFGECKGIIGYQVLIGTYQLAPDPYQQIPPLWSPPPSRLPHMTRPLKRQIGG